MKTILVLWLITSSGVSMTTRTVPSADACETAGRAWQGSAVSAATVTVRHGYACLPMWAGN